MNKSLKENQEKKNGKGNEAFEASWSTVAQTGFLANFHWNESLVWFSHQAFTTLPVLDSPLELLLTILLLS